MGKNPYDFNHSQIHPDNEAQNIRRNSIIDGVNMISTGKYVSN